MNTIIHQLHVKAPKREQQASLRALEQHSWPEISDEWIFVRELRIKAHSQHLGREASHSLKSVAQYAVDGRSPAAIQANVVKFPTLPCLLAFLMRDINLKQVGQAWYWRQWQYLQYETPSTAISKLFYQYSEHIPAVLGELATIEHLAETWMTMTEQAAEQILSLFITQRLAHKPNTQTKREDVSERVKHTIHTLSRIQPRLIAQWHKVAIQSTAQDTRMQLATAILLRQYLPELATTYNPCEISGLMRQALMTEKAERASQTETHKQASKNIPQQQPKVLQPSRKTNNATESHGSTSSFLSTAASTLPQKTTTDTPEEQTESPRPKQHRQKVTKLTEASTKQSSNIHSPSVIPTAPDETEQTPIFKEEHGESQTVSSHFVTNYGGIFYLINALRLDIGEEWPWPYNPWLWLFDLLNILKVEADVPLKHYLAMQALTDPKSLDKRPLNKRAQAWLTQRPRPLGNLLKAELIQVPSQIRYTPSHIDCDFPMSSVRLDVRLAGLDINPGWVPWLGRVVHFHYRTTE